jgi:Fe-S cluster assembly protein SufD
MTTAATMQDVFLSHYTQREKELAGSSTPWLNHLRQEAIHRFAELGLPTTRNEEWKYTNVAPLARARFQPARAGEARLALQDLAGVPGADLGGPRLVFLNGHFAPEFSSVDELPDAVKVQSLAAVLANGAEVVQGHLGRYAAFENQPFVALNTAFVEDGAFVEIPQGLVVEKPIHLLFVTTAAVSATAAHPRTLVVAGAGTQATIIETYLGLGSGVYFNNVVSEIVLGENAVVDHYRVEREVEQAFHIATLQACLSRSSSFTSENVALGGGLVRNDVNGLLDGEGADCALNGLYVIRRRQHVDNHTVIDHAQPHCTSRELYKGILDGRATGVFNGVIKVRKDAQKTDSVQQNKNLLLSRDALINTKPQLEIFADDVKCTHGATIGQLDKDALFYLRARGIQEEQARSLLIYAFASEVVERFRVEPLREVLHSLLSGYLSTPETHPEGP